MKTILFLTAMLVSLSVFSQAPEKMSYQAIIRNSGGQLISSAAVGTRVSILQGAPNGPSVYSEVHSSNTNTNGLLTLQVGTGSMQTGNFSTIDWSSGPYFIFVETDPTGGTNYTISGSTQLLSVPYALYAKNSGSSTPGPQGPQGPAGNDGANGTNGTDGVGITSTVDNGNGTYTFNYSDGSSFTTSNLTGPQGNAGPQGPAGNDGTNGTNGTNGTDGVGITSTVNNGNGTYTFNYSDGSSFTTSNLTGPQGNVGPQGPAGNDGTNGTNGTNGTDGVGITSTVNNGNGTYTFNYSDGSSFTTSNLTGPQGPQGNTGPQGPAGNDGTNGTNGTNGTDGVGITSTVNNGNGTYTFNYSDGSSFTTANLTGPQGPQGNTGPQGPAGNDGTNGTNGTNGTDGVGITSTVNNGDGTYTFNYSDGSGFTTSNLTGPQGAIGPQGAPGTDGVNGVGITSTVDNNNGTFTINYSDGSSFTTSDLTGPQGPAGPAGGSDNDWLIEGTTNPPTAITDEMYHMGNIAIGKNTADYQLEVAISSGNTCCEYHR